MFLRILRPFRRFCTEKPQKSQSEIKAERRQAKEYLQKRGVVAKQLGRQVAQLRTPAEEETDIKVLQQMLDVRRKDIQSSNKQTQIPQEYKKNMLALLTPIPLISLGYVVSELTGRMDYMPILQWSALNYFYLNAFFLSGIDLSSVIMSHSLSVDRVKTTAQNWVKILVSTIPSQIALLSLIFGPSAWTLPILSMTLIGYLPLGILFKDDMPRWLLRARMAHCLLTICFGLSLCWYYSQNSYQSQQYWKVEVSTERKVVSLKLSQI